MIEQPDHVTMIIYEYLREKGIDPDLLEELTEEEFNNLCSDAQIDLYLRGKLESLCEK